MSRNFVLFAALLLAGLSCNAFAQAAAESALAHSASGTAASKLSSDIGTALNKTLNRITDRMQQQAQQPQSAPTTRPKSSNGPIFSPVGPGASSAPTARPAVAPTNTTGQPGIASIQGGIQCSPSAASNCQIAAKRSNTTNQSVIKLGKQ